MPDAFTVLCRFRQIAIPDRFSPRINFDSRSNVLVKIAERFVEVASLWSSSCCCCNCGGDGGDMMFDFRGRCHKHSGNVDSSLLVFWAGGTPEPKYVVLGTKHRIGFP